MACQDHFSGGWFQLYPPLHYYILTLSYAPFWILHTLHVLNFHAFPVYTVLFFLGRLISLLMGTAAVFMVYRCGLEIYDRRSSIFAAFITSLIAPFIFYAKITCVDIPYTFWVIFSLFFFIRILKKHSLPDYLLFASTAALAVCTKDQAYGFYVLTCAAIVISHHFSARKDGKNAGILRSLVHRNIVLSVLLAAVLFLAIHNVLLNREGFLAHVQILFQKGGKINRLYPNSVSGHATMFWQSLKHLRFSMGWPFFLAGVGGVLASIIRKRRNNLLLSLLIPAVSYYIFVSLTLSNYVRYFIPICVILSLFGGWLLSGFLKPGSKFHAIRVVVVSLAFVYSIVYAVSVDILMARDSRYHVEQWLEKNIESNAVIGITDSAVYLPRLDGYKTVHIDASMQDVERKKPDYIILNAENYRNAQVKRTIYNFHIELNRRMIPYERVLDYRFNSKWILLNLNGMFTNLDKINPRIQVFKRLGREEERPAGSVKGMTSGHG
jgi:hypothetical protein